MTKELHIYFSFRQNYYYGILKCWRAKLVLPFGVDLSSFLLCILHTSNWTGYTTVYFSIDFWWFCIHLNINIESRFMDKPLVEIPRTRIVHVVELLNPLSARLNKQSCSIYTQAVHWTSTFCNVPKPASPNPLTRLSLGPTS